MDTIFALATAQGKAGVAVVRISGPQAVSVAEEFCDLPPAREARLRPLVAPGAGFLDRALVLVFPGQQSFTGEPVVEFHLHGSRAVIQAILKFLGRVPGARLAEPGEFTRRALENGRLDLTQVEALADLIDAETESQRLQAVRVLEGRLSKAVDAWRTDLIRAAALLEAVIDFADEDVPEDVSPEVVGLLERVRVSMRHELSGFESAERIREGFEVAIVGAPNVGKSTLLNALAGRDAAITSDVAGTTRDVIEVRMDLDGIPVTLLDTAGLRETDDIVEGLGIERARKRALAANVRIVLLAPGQTHDLPLWDGDIRLRAKVDRDDGQMNGISGKTGFGVDLLLQQLTQTLLKRSGSSGLITRERQRAALEQAIGGLESARRLVDRGSDLYDLAAEELRGSIRGLESLIGRVDVENLLDEIFASFCLGK